MKKRRRDKHWREEFPDLHLPAPGMFHRQDEKMEGEEKDEEDKEGDDAERAEEEEEQEEDGKIEKKAEKAGHPIAETEQL